MYTIHYHLLDLYLHLVICCLEDLDIKTLQKKGNHTYSTMLPVCLKFIAVLRMNFIAGRQPSGHGEIVQRANV